MKAASAEVRIPAAGVVLDGTLEAAPGAQGVVVFSHGSGSGRHSVRNRFVAGRLREAGMATLLLDLLTPDEDRNFEARFDIDLLTDRLAGAVDCVRRDPALGHLGIGLFGASTGAASALRVAADDPAICAVVSRGGRPDLAGERHLSRVTAATLLIVGGADAGVLELNRAALEALGARETRLIVVPGATHLFEEPGALEAVARHAADWFAAHLGAAHHNTAQPDVTQRDAAARRNPR